MGHQETLTTTTPLERGASSANCAESRSTTRLPCAASRSDAMQWTTLPVAKSRIVMRVPRGRYHVAHRPGMYRYHVASPMRYFLGFDLCRSVVVVTGTWQIVVVVVGATVVVVVVVGATVVVVVVVSPGTLDVDVGSDDVVVGGTVDVVGVHVGLRFFFTVVVVTGLCAGLLGFGRLVEPVRGMVACPRT